MTSVCAGRCRVRRTRSTEEYRAPDPQESAEDVVCDEPAVVISAAPATAGANVRTMARTARARSSSLRTSRRTRGLARGAFPEEEGVLLAVQGMAGLAPDQVSHLVPGDRTQGNESEEAARSTCPPQRRSRGHQQRVAGRKNPTNRPVSTKTITQTRTVPPIGSGP